MSKKYSDALWAEAKKKCRLNVETLEMAKEMGLNPRSLIKNIPDKKQQWKAPVKIWIEDMYEKRQEKSLKKALKKKMKEDPPAPPPPDAKKERARKKQATIALNDIVVPEAFLEIKPNEKKLQREINFYKKHGRFEKTMVVKQKNMTLLESYTLYVAAKKAGLEEVYVRFK